MLRSNYNYNLILDITIRDMFLSLSKQKTKNALSNIAFIAFNTIKFPHIKIIEIGVIFVDHKEMCKLNLEYLEEDGTTDVISVPLQEMIIGQWKLLSKDYIHLGDIFINLEYAAEEANKLGIETIQHVLHLFIHGLLHLLGYDHLLTEEAKLMRNLESQIITKFLDNHNGAIYG